VCGGLILIGRQARAAATWLAVVTTVLVILLYVPMFVVARKPADVITAINYIADTLLFAGSIMLLADAVPAGRAREAHQPARSGAYSSRRALG